MSGTYQELVGRFHDFTYDTHCNRKTHNPTTLLATSNFKE